MSRQIDLVESGERVIQETRTWNVQKSATAPMRDKETADDYRYFPEPDLQPVTVSEEELEAARKSIPRLTYGTFSILSGKVENKTWQSAYFD